MKIAINNIISILRRILEVKMTNAQMRCDCEGRFFVHVPRCERNVHQPVRLPRLDDLAWVLQMVRKRHVWLLAEGH